MANNSEKVERPPLAKHDSSTLDLVFAMDCTGSMGSYIKTATENIRKISEEIVSSEKCDIRLALIEYRDHPPQDSTFVTRVHDFTGSVGTMKKWLDGCSATGGGDTPEAVADALHQVLKLSWRDNATKICVFIADAPPHGLSSSGDKFPNGCPDGLDPLVVTRDIAEKGITLYMVGCEPSITPYKDFMMTLSFLTGGQYVPLSAAKLLTQVIIGGAQEEMSLERFMEDVNQQVEQEVQAAGGRFDESEIATKIHSAYRSKGTQAKQLKMNKSSLPQASSQAKAYGGMSSMSEVQCAYMKAEPTASRYTEGLEAEPTASRYMKAEPTASSPGLMSSMLGGLRSAVFGAPASTPAPRAAASSIESSRMPMSREASDMYDVEEEDVSEEQVMRMVKKSKARKGY